MITKKAYTEAYIVLETLDLLKELPYNFVQVIKSNIISNYKFYIDKDVPIKFQVDDKETLSLLSYIYTKYFCNNDGEIQDIKKSIEENALENTKKRSKDFDIERVIKKNMESEIKQEIQIAEIKKESLFIRIIHKLKNFINKK